MREPTQQQRVNQDEIYAGVRVMSVLECTVRLPGTPPLHCTLYLNFQPRRWLWVKLWVDQQQFWVLPPAHCSSLLLLSAFSSSWCSATSKAISHIFAASLCPSAIYWSSALTNKQWKTTQAPPPKNKEPSCVEDRICQHSVTAGSSCSQSKHRPEVLSRTAGFLASGCRYCFMHLQFPLWEENQETASFCKSDHSFIALWKNKYFLLKQD